MKIRSGNQSIKGDDGNTTVSEREKLFELASQVKAGVIVELGSFVGGSTVYLAKGSKNQVPIYAVDPDIDSVIDLNYQSNNQLLQENLKEHKCDVMVHCLREYSFNAIKTFNESVGLLFIDGDHSYRVVKLDVKHWEPRVVSEGVIAFHDIWTISVGLVVSKFLLSGRVGAASIVGGLLWAQKVKSAPIDLIQNFFISLLLVLVGTVQLVAIRVPGIKALDDKFKLRLRAKKILSLRSN